MAPEEPAHVAGSDSEDEGIRNTIGNVPLEWYDEYDHIGYTVDGKRFMRPPQRDELDELVQRFEQGNHRVVYDSLHGEYVELTDEDMHLIRSIQAGRYPHASFDPFPDAPDTGPFPDSALPMFNRPEPKSRFVPSKHDRRRVVKLVRAMRSENYQKSIEGQRARREAMRPDYNYAIWDETLEDLTREQRRMQRRLLPPKQLPPGNAESYNPPPEYLFTTEEEEAWHAADPSDRDLDFIPRKFDSMRKIPAYHALVQERFSRCLDLYLCPRTQRTRINIAPESLLPQLPDLSQLEPYPKRLGLSFTSATGKRVRSLSVHAGGQWLASGGDDGILRAWEVGTGRCALECDMGTDVPIHHVAFAPLEHHFVVAVSCGSALLILSLPELGRSGSRVEHQDDVGIEKSPKALANTVVEWEHRSLPAPRLLRGRARPVGHTRHLCLAVPHSKAVHSIAWHHRGDYVATVVPDAGARAVLLHQISRRVTQQPFGRSKGRVESGVLALRLRGNLSVCDRRGLPSSTRSTFPSPQARALCGHPATCAGLRFGAADLDQKACLWRQVDFVDGYSPGWRQPHYRLVRQAGGVV